MSNIRIDLSSQEAKSRFQDLVAAVIESHGQVTGDVRAFLERKGQELGIHPLDVEEAIQEHAQALPPQANKPQPDKAEGMDSDTQVAAVNLATPSRSRRGTVKWFNETKGFGFIEQDGGGEDIFVHHAAIEVDGYRSLKEGQRVTFELINEAKGLRAAKVKIEEAIQKHAQSLPPQANKLQPDKAEGMDSDTHMAGDGSPIYGGKGAVKWFDATKGHGFIEREDGGEDVFFRFSAIEGDDYASLHQGQYVSFLLDPDSMGLRAVKVKLWKRE